MRALIKQPLCKALINCLVICIIVSGVFGGCSGVKSAEITPLPQAVETVTPLAKVDPAAAPQPTDASLAEKDTKKADTPQAELAGDGGLGIYLSKGVTKLAESGRSINARELQVLNQASWAVQLTRSDVTLLSGKKHSISFVGSSAVLRSGTIKLQDKTDPYDVYINESFEVNAEAKAYSFEFEMTGAADSEGLLTISFGAGYPGMENTDSEEHKISIDKLVISIFDEEKQGQLFNVDIPKIHVDQTGYVHSEKKYAIINSEDKYFEIYDSELNQSVYRGAASEQAKSYTSDELVRIADFSELRTGGTYYIQNSEGRSYDFEISENPYNELAEAVLEMFDFQICGAESEAEEWSHEACHTQTAGIYGTETQLDVSGGWHNSGDYGRYVVPAAKALADILMAYERGYVTDNKVLDVAKNELDWLIKMQDKATGGVYHKVTGENYNSVIMPQFDKGDLTLSPVTSTATADFAAIMAMSARIYEGDFADRALIAAEKAWEWLEANPAYNAFKNPDGITTSEYSDISDSDERYWAACELFHTTLNDKYHDAIKNSIAYQGFGWANMGYYGSISYLYTPLDKIEYDTYQRIEASVYDGAKLVFNAYKEDPYKISLGSDYTLGSNMHAANNAMLLIYGYKMSKDDEYIQAARDHLHYLLGRNSLSQSFVTGFGTQAPVSPHHKPSQFIGSAMPGMLVGGPNSNLEDPYAAFALKGVPAAKAYIDNELSYSTNEAAIYYNSPLYFILSYIQNLAEN